MPTPTASRLLFIAANPMFVRLFLRDAIRLLLAEGHTVLVACGPEPGPQRLQHELGCPVVALPLPREISLLPDLNCLLELKRIIREWKPTMVHTHTPKAGLLGSVAAWLERVPVRIHTFHGLRSETLTGTRGRIVQAMERITARASTHSLAVSLSLREELIQRNICPAAKLQVLGLGSCAGVALERFTPADWTSQAAAFRALHGIGADQLLVTYVGRLAQDKGLAVLEAAWQQVRSEHPTAHLLVAGPADATDACSPATLASLRNDKRVTLLEGFVTEVAPILAASDIFVQPSFREGLGVAALEAAAMKVPVVASRVTGLVDAVDAGRSGLLVKAGSVHALAGAIGQLLYLPNLRHAMGEEARRFVECRFSRQLVLTRLIAWYREVLPTHARRPQPAKRCFDLAVATSLLILTAPILLLTAAAVFINMGGPVLFRQQRAGLDGAPFWLLKFRTMRAPRADEPMYSTDAARTTWLGTWMRRLSLDELPQLINVLRGEMSLVGPRPLLLEYLPRYNAEQFRRHEVKPGITGWAQVHGRNNLNWHERFAKDVWYVNHCSLRLDLQILAKTIQKVLKPEGIVPTGQTSMTEFTGTTTR